MHQTNHVDFLHYVSVYAQRLKDFIWLLVGHSANYAIVVAQLYTKGQCHGIHPFIVQLRDIETHMPLSGIKIGELGCKFGMNSTNNGYLGFEKFRIPRANMLMKNNQVLPVSIHLMIQIPIFKLGENYLQNGLLFRMAPM